MANRDLVEIGQGAKEHEVVEIQIVAGVDPQPERLRQNGGFSVHLKRATSLGGPRPEGAGEGLGVQRHTVGASRGGPPNRIRKCVDEYADPDAARSETGDNLGEPVASGARTKGGLTRHLRGG